MNKTSVDDLQEFLGYLGKKGLITPNNAASKKAAVGKLFSVLTEGERVDVFALDIDEVVSRFTNLHRQEYKPGSLQAYISRVRGALEDFRRHVDDPVNFRISSASPPKANRNGSSVGTKGMKQPPREEVVDSKPPIHHPASEAVFPIPIRENMTVKIYGLPFDLTESEANKIAAVIRAMAL
jgi:hypothetical protein